MAATGKPRRLTNNHSGKMTVYGNLMDPIYAHHIRKLSENGNGKSQVDNRLGQFTGVGRGQLMVAQDLELIERVNDECEYPDTISKTTYKFLYDREPIAARVVECLPDLMWQTNPSVYEDDDPECETEFEIAFDQMCESLRGDSWYEPEEFNPLWEILRRADKLSRIGTFGVLLIGIDDGKPLHEPVEGIDECGRSSVKAKSDKEKEQLEKQDGIGPSEEKPFGEDRALPESLGDTARTAEGGVAETPDGEADGRGQDSSISEPNQSKLPAQRPDAPPTPSPQEESPAKPKPEVKTKRKILYLRAFDESQIQIGSYESDEKNPRYGQPKTYSLMMRSPSDSDQTGIGAPSNTVEVHWTRCIHIADNLGSSDVFAAPAMRPVFNRLLDLLKLYGGSAEMYWKGAFPGLAMTTHPQLGGDVVIDAEQTKEETDEYFAGLNRALLGRGMEINSLAPQVVDPGPQIDVQITAICIQIDVPKRVFMGSEQGVLAADQDNLRLEKKKQARRTNYGIPRLIVPVTDRLIAMEVLPVPRSCRYKVAWEEELSLSPAEKADVALKRTQAITTFAEGGGENYMTKRDHMTREMGFTDEEADSMEEAQAEMQPVLDEEQQLQMDHELEMQELAPSPIVGGGGQPPFGGKPGMPPNGPQSPVDASGGKGVGKPSFPPRKRSNAKPFAQGGVLQNATLEGATESDRPFAENYDPSQPRDDDGKWIDTGGGFEGRTEQLPDGRHVDVDSSDIISGGQYDGQHFQDVYEEIRIKQRRIESGELQPEDEEETFDEVAIDKRLDKILGDGDYSSNDVLKAVGADRRGEAIIEAGKNSLEVHIDHPEYVCERLLRIDSNGKPFIKNEYFKAKKAGEGVGTEVFSRQVTKAKSMGFAYIECHAAQSRNLNGYYTWPRLGYDAPLTGIPEAKQRFPGVETVLDVFEREGGAEWWKENGVALPKARFDLSDGSRSLKVLNAYREERRQRAG